MIKILFCLQTMVCGGVEKELITILKRFDRSIYNLSLLLLYEQDIEMKKLIPEDVKIVNLNIDKQYYCEGFLGIVKSRVKRGEIAKAAKLIFGKILKNGATPAIIKLDDIPQISEEFDYAVCYHMHSPIVLRYVADSVNARYKIAWIHNDFLTTRYRIDKYDNWLKKYNVFIAVSNQLKEEFQIRCPQYSNIITVVHNIVDAVEIKKKAVNFSGVERNFLNDRNIKIVTVGRFVEQKGFDIAIRACKELVEQRIPITWYAIGYGKDEMYLKKMIVQEKIENNFVILGRKENPYPYMAKADFYVQPSRHEGFVITIAEAKVLHKAIVCTDFAGAREQIENGINGIILSESTAECLSCELKKLINNPALVERFTKKLEDCRNDNEWNKIENVFRRGGL